MIYRRIGLIALAVLAVLAIAAFALIWRSELPVIAEDAQPRADGELAARGFALAQLGNCASCHTARGGEPYAGGRPMATPFGTIYATNITPDRETGIGAWSEEAFARAMREGIDREGGHLYPAFPYDHFTKVSDADISALYAFLRSVPAVRNEAPKNDLAFPFNIRPLIAGWNLLFLDEGPLEPVSGQSDEWNTGRYLVEGLAHCGACHTPRNFLGAEKSSKRLAGAETAGWFAPALQGEGARSWTEARMMAYLSTGFSRDHGAAAGPMAETVTNLAQAAPDDVAAIATYAASLTEDAASAVTTARDNGVPEQQAKAHDLWVGACAVCHGNPAGMDNDLTGPSLGIPLSIGAAVHEEDATNAVRTIVGGIDAYRDMGGPYMPDFGDTLTPAQITDLTRYIRARFADGPDWPDIENTVEKALDAQRKGGEG